MKQNGYTFKYLGSNTIGADQYLKETHVYVFASEKSGHRYQVNIERYVEHLYCVDFYSMCVLINRKAVPDMDAYMQRIINFIV